MSAKSLNKLKQRFDRGSDKSHSEEVHKKYDWSMLALLPLWVTAAFLASNLIVLALLSVLTWLHMPLDGILRPAVLQTGIATLIYAITIAIVIGVPYFWRHTTNPALLGLSRLVTWTDIGLAPVVFIVYTLIVSSLLALIAAWIPSFPIDQTQDVGFQAFGTQFDNILAFVTLVIMAPLAEEVLFRGYLYGKLKGHVPAIVAAIATSLLFGLAHMQWNVGIDVFVLSLILCGLRSLTGSIWAGILVHMIKNGIAYYLLFISPLIGG